jgi:hypothetical protein
MDASNFQPTQPSTRRFARLLASLVCLSLAAPALANSHILPSASPQPAQAQPQPQPKRSDLRLAVQSREKAAPARQLSPEERVQMRTQIRELRRAPVVTPIPGERP